MQLPFKDPGWAGRRSQKLQGCYRPYCLVKPSVTVRQLHWNRPCHACKVGRSNTHRLASRAFNSAVQGRSSQRPGCRNLSRGRFLDTKNTGILAPYALGINTSPCRREVPELPQVPDDWTMHLLWEPPSVATQGRLAHRVSLL